MAKTSLFSFIMRMVVLKLNNIFTQVLKLKSINISSWKFSQCRNAFRTITSQSKSIRTSITLQRLFVINCILWTLHTIFPIPKRCLRWTRFTALILIWIMSSCWTIVTFLTNEIPILWLNTSDTSSLKLIWCLFWTYTSVLIVIIYMTVLTSHTFPCLCHPKVRRVTVDTNIVCC